MRNSTLWAYVSFLYSVLMILLILTAGEHPTPVEQGLVFAAGLCAGFALSSSILSYLKGD